MAEAAPSGEWRHARSDRGIGAAVFALACVVLLVGVAIGEVPPVVMALVIGPYAGARAAFAHVRMRQAEPPDA